MTASMQGGWCVVGPGRLAEIVARIAGERRPERLGPAVLDAALAATGARGGRVAAGGPPERQDGLRQGQGEGQHQGVVAELDDHRGAPSPVPADVAAAAPAPSFQ